MACRPCLISDLSGPEMLVDPNAQSIHPLCHFALEHRYVLVFDFVMGAAPRLESLALAQSTLESERYGGY